MTFAITKLYLGDTQPDGTPDAKNGWKHFGYDIDGKIATAASRDLCKPTNSDLSPQAFVDGDDGIDNSFGEIILPILLAVASDFPVKVNEGLKNGSTTYLLDLQKLGAGADYNPVETRAYVGAKLDNAPKFDGMDTWPVTTDSLNGSSDLSSAKVIFNQSYLVGNTWVSAPGADVKLSLPYGDTSLPLVIHHAVVTMKLGGDHQTASKGVISGILSPSEVKAAIKNLVGSFDASLCSGPTSDSILGQVDGAADILSDGTQSSAKTCDGISIGLGFDAAIVQLGSAKDAASSRDPCAP